MAEAIERYDFTRGVRFTTFVFEFVIRTLAEGARHRVGRPIATRADRRAARLAGEERDREAAAGNSIDITRRRRRLQASRPRPRIAHSCGWSASTT